jgi:hypothetical protein
MTAVLRADAQADEPGTSEPPRLTVRPAPRREPPFDDEITAAHHLRVVGPHDRPLPFEPTGARQPQFTIVAPRTELPDPALWGRRLLVGILEAASGKRPLQQLAGLMSPSVALGLRADLERSGDLRRPHWTQAASVRSTRATEPREGVAEVCATVQHGPRVRAVALRAEAHQGRWRCTRLQIG